MEVKMKRILALTATGALLLLAACNQPLASTGTSDLTVLLTDAPATEASWIRVDFGRIDLVPSEGSEDGILMLSDDGGTIENVLELQNGDVTTLVGDLAIPDGSYEQIRLIVTEVTIGFGEQGSEEIFEVFVPSGVQTGLKINVEPALVAQAGTSSEIVLDFDAARAVVETPPGSQEYQLKPTGIRAVSESGILEGTVLGTEGPLEGVTVNVHADGAVDPVATTVTEADGTFRFITLAEGTYDVEIVADGYAPEVLEDNAVTIDEATDVGEVTLTPL